MSDFLTISGDTGINKSDYQQFISAFKIRLNKQILFLTLQHWAVWERVGNSSDKLNQM